MSVGDRVEIPAHTDYWMAGDRFGTVSKVQENSAGRHLVTVVMDKSGKSHRWLAEYLRSI